MRWFNWPVKLWSWVRRAVFRRVPLSSLPHRRRRKPKRLPEEVYEDYLFDEENDSGSREWTAFEEDDFAEYLEGNSDPVPRVNESMFDPAGPPADSPLDPDRVFLDERIRVSDENEQPLEPAPSQYTPIKRTHPRRSQEPDSNEESRHGSSSFPANVQNGDPWRNAAIAAKDGIDEPCRRFFWFSRGTSLFEVLLATAEVDDAPRQRLRPFKPSEKLYYNRLPHSQGVRQGDFACHVVWGDEPSSRLPGQLDIQWIDAPRAAFLAMIGDDRFHDSWFNQPDASFSAIVVLILATDGVERYDWYPRVDLFNELEAAAPHPDATQFYPDDEMNALVRDLELDCKQDAAGPLLYVLLAPDCRPKHYRELATLLKSQFRDSLFARDHVERFLLRLARSAKTRWSEGANFPSPVDVDELSLHLPHTFAGSIVEREKLVSSETANVRVRLEEGARRTSLQFTLGSKVLQSLEIHAETVDLEVCKTTESVRLHQGNNFAPHFPLAVHDRDFSQKSELDSIGSQKPKIPSAELSVFLFVSPASCSKFFWHASTALSRLEDGLRGVTILHQTENGLVSCSFKEEEWRAWREAKPADRAYQLKRFAEDASLSFQSAGTEDAARHVYDILTRESARETRSVLFLVDDGFSFPNDSMWWDLSSQWAWHFNLRRRLGGAFSLLTALFENSKNVQPVRRCLEQLTLSAGQTFRLNRMISLWNESTEIETVESDVLGWRQIAAASRLRPWEQDWRRRRGVNSPHVIEEVVVEPPRENQSIAAPFAGAEISRLDTNESVCWLKSPQPTSREALLKRLARAIGSERP